jgi:hypothetical protein
MEFTTNKRSNYSSSTSETAQHIETDGTSLTNVLYLVGWKIGGINGNSHNLSVSPSDTNIRFIEQYINKGFNHVRKEFSIGTVRVGVSQGFHESTSEGFSTIFL